MQQGTKLRLSVAGAEKAAPMAPIPFQGDLSDIVSGAAAAGYQAVELHIPDIWEFDVRSLRKLSKNAGVAVSALVTGQLFVRQSLSLSSRDEVIQTKAVEGLKLFVEAAAKLDCGIVVGWVRGKVGADAKGCLARQGEALRAICAYAKGEGVPVYLEAINRYELDSLNNASAILDFIGEHELQGAYVHLDTFHMNIEEYSAERAIRQCGPLLGYFHVAENTRHHPGYGCLDFDTVFRALREIGYTGYVSVECLPLPSGPEAARRAHEFLTPRYFA